MYELRFEANKEVVVTVIVHNGIACCKKKWRKLLDRENAAMRGFVITCSLRVNIYTYINIYGQ